jgi:hypothetical protein
MATAPPPLQATWGPRGLFQPGPCSQKRLNRCPSALLRPHFLLCKLLCGLCVWTFSLWIYNFSEERLRNDLQKCPGDRAREELQAPAPTPYLSSSPASQGLWGPEGPLSPDKPPLLRPGFAFLIPSVNTYSHWSRQDKGTELEEGSAEGVG